MAITLGSAAVLFCAIAAVFWFQDLRYARPTPVPVGYQPPLAGSVVPLPPALSTLAGESRPILLHFFNQDCPCSRFNLDQARTLAETFRGRVRFVLVLQMPDTAPAARQAALAEARQKFGNVEGVVDVEGRIAAQYGVYSTPQAVILDPHGAIAFRGNYNVSRYCTDPVTAFARVALEEVLAGHKPPLFPALAYQAYGCELPQASLR